ncbi:MAG: biotin--[acetyl-CoA-carboxylase] ligase, partial [Robiginitomaculum sp.]|nr:biotin--[acetyl-CoA-carboxylase] ligase [Robiginitomaculum sp.]
MRFVHFKSIDSTLSEARRRAQAGDSADQWISADSQTEGRGRRGRDWVSDGGNLFCTGLFDHRGDLASAARLSFA